MHSASSRSTPGKAGVSSTVPRVIASAASFSRWERAGRRWKALWHSAAGSRSRKRCCAVTGWFEVCSQSLASQRGKRYVGAHPVREKLAGTVRRFRAQGALLQTKKSPPKRDALLQDEK